MKFSFILNIFKLNQNVNENLPYVLISCTIDVNLLDFTNVFQILLTLAGYEELTGDLSQSEIEECFE